MGFHGLLYDDGYANNGARFAIDTPETANKTVRFRGQELRSCSPGNDFVYNPCFPRSLGEPNDLKMAERNG